PRPALVPLTTDVAWVRELSGLTVPDAAVQLFNGERGEPIDQRRGSLLFTHFGLSGPVILDISGSFTLLASPLKAKLICDFLPEMSAQQLEEDFRRAGGTDGKRLIVGLVAEKLPRRLVETVLSPAGGRAERGAAASPEAARGVMVRANKGAEVPLSGARGLAEAEEKPGGEG